MINSNPNPSSQSRIQRIVTIFTLLALVFTLAIIAFFTIYKCDQNCSFHHGYSTSCISDGSLYCCKGYGGEYSAYSCGGYSECQFDNSQCGNFIIGLEVLGAIVTLGVGVILINAFCPNSMWKKQSQISVQRNQPLLRNSINQHNQQQQIIVEESLEVQEQTEVDSSQTAQTDKKELILAKDQKFQQ